MELVMKDARALLKFPKLPSGANSTKLWFTRLSLHMPLVPVRVLVRRRLALEVSGGGKKPWRQKVLVVPVLVPSVRPSGVPVV